MSGEPSQGMQMGLGRQVGGHSKGAIKRGTNRQLAPGVRGYSSIPSKYETIINVGNKAPDGFACRTHRFDETENDLPGPGSYIQAGQGQMLIDSDSISKKGYGSGFVSKDRRFKRQQEFFNVPGPGAYEGARVVLRHQEHKDFNRAGNTHMFMNKLTDVGPPLEPKINKKEDPGPGEYNPDLKGTTNYTEKFISSNFKSTSSRLGGDKEEKLAKSMPSPGSYNVNIINTSFRPPKLPSAAFRDTSQRVDVTGVAGPSRKNTGAPSIIYNDVDGLNLEANPGPGEYWYEKEDLSNRLLGGMAGRSSAAFSTTKTDRFGRPNEKRTSTMLTPGPGSYESKSGLNPNGTSGAFQSTSLRTDAFGQGNPSAMPPGPAFYHPAVNDKKSFHLNARKRWM